MPPTTKKIREEARKKFLTRLLARQVLHKEANAAKRSALKTKVKDLTSGGGDNG